MLFILRQLVSKPGIALFNGREQGKRQQPYWCRQQIEALEEAFGKL